MDGHDVGREGGNITESSLSEWGNSPAVEGDDELTASGSAEHPSQ